MKLRNITLAVALLIGGTAFAQNAAVTDNNSTEARAENISNRLAKELKLNAKQLEKVKAIQSEELTKKEAIKKLRREEMVSEREAIARQRKALKEDKEALESKRAELQAKRDAYDKVMKGIEENSRDKMKNILSEEQYEKYLMLLGKKQAKQNAIKTKAKAKPMPIGKTE